MSRVVVREMQIEDLKEVMPLEKEIFSVPWTENGFFTYLTREDALFLVAEENGKICGYCGVVMALDEGDITNVAVAKEARNKGIGGLLVESLLRFTAQRGIKTLFLEVRESNETAIRLYKRCGFAQIGIRAGYYQDPKEDALVMKSGGGCS